MAIRSTVSGPQGFFENLWLACLMLSKRPSFPLLGKVRALPDAGHPGMPWQHGQQSLSLSLSPHKGTWMPSTPNAAPPTLLPLPGPRLPPPHTL
eukprot:355034-Chlamydomonas_euryale.AAC.4